MMPNCEHLSEDESERQMFTVDESDSVCVSVMLLAVSDPVRSEPRTNTNSDHW